MGIEVKTSMDVDRSAAIEGVGTAGTLVDAFAKPVGSLFGPAQVSSGPQLVGKVVAKTPGDPAELEKQIVAIRAELKSKKQSDRSTLFEEGLKKRLTDEGKLKINQAALSRLLQNYTNRS